MIPIEKIQARRLELERDTARILNQTSCDCGAGTGQVHRETCAVNSPHPLRTAQNEMDKACTEFKPEQVLQQRGGILGNNQTCPICGGAHTQAEHPWPPEQVRGATHGDYTLMADRIQRIKSAMHSGPRWDDLNAGQREALELIATKIGRIVCGDPNFRDSWDDIRGYTQLVLDRIGYKKG